MNILNKTIIIISIVLIGLIYGVQAGSKEIRSFEKFQSASAWEKPSAINTPASCGKRVIVKLKKPNITDRHNKFPKFGNPLVMKILKERTEERRAAILKTLKNNRRSFAKRSWIPFLRKPVKKTTAPLNPRSLWLADSIAVTVTREELKDLKNNPEVEEIVENAVLCISPVVLGSDEKPDAGKSLWNHSLIGVEAARELGLDGTGVRIGLLDTGINPDLPDLAGKLAGWAEFNESGLKIDSQPHESHVSGHGTHVASVMVGDTTGIAPGAELIAALVLPGGYGTLEQVLAGMQWVIDPDGDPETDDGARIVNMSLGMRGTSQVLREAVINMIKSGILPVCAIGNSGFEATYSPGNVPEAIGVGAVNEYDSSLMFSSGGEACWDGLCVSKPDITAPGAHIPGLGPNGDYQTMSGTSLAAPHVAAAAALIMQQNPLLSVSELKSFLISSSRDLGRPGSDYSFGRGRLDLSAAVYFLDHYSERFKAADLVLEETKDFFGAYTSHTYKVFFSNGMDRFVGEENSSLNLTVKNEESAINTVGFGDVDGNGIKDLIVTEIKPAEEDMFIINYRVALSLNGAPFSGEMRTWYSYNSALPEAYEVIGLADLNGDKKTDLVLADREAVGLGEKIHIFPLLSSGSGFYQNSNEDWVMLTYYHSYNNVNFLLGDINGDTRADLVLVKSRKNNYNLSPVYYYAYLSSGYTFENLSRWLTVFPGSFGGATRFETLSDLDGDGLDDLLLLKEISRTTPDNLSARVYYSNGISGFNYSGEWAQIELPEDNISINAGDVNGDGIADLVLGGFDRDRGAAVFSTWPADSSGEEFYPGEETEITPDSEDVKITGILNVGLGNWRK